MYTKTLGCGSCSAENSCAAAIAMTPALQTTPSCETNNIPNWLIFLIAMGVGAAISKSGHRRSS